MTNTVNDRSHQEFKDLLSAAAFGALTEEEGVLLREHLDTCLECRRELSEFQIIASALPLTLDELQPSPRLRNRLLAIVQHEHRTAEPAPVTMRRPTPIPNVEGDLTYLPDQQVFRLTMENMPAAPHDHVYQVWLIDDSGPIPAGVMDQPEFAVAADRARYDALAITVHDRAARSGP